MTIKEQVTPTSLVDSVHLIAVIRHKHLLLLLAQIAEHKHCAKLIASARLEELSVCPLDTDYQVYAKRTAHHQDFCDFALDLISSLLVKKVN